MRARRLLNLAHDATRKPHRIPNFLFRNAIRPLVRSAVERDEFDRVLDSAALLTYLKQQEDCDFWSYADAETYNLAEPDCCPDTPAELTREVGKIKFDRPFVCSLRDAWILGPEPIVATPFGDFLLESATGRKNMITRGIVKSLSSGVNPFKRRGKPNFYDYDRLCLLTGPLSEAYAHWFHDYLTRLEGLEHYIRVTGNRPPLLVQSDPPSWMSRSLQYLGYTSDDLVKWDESIGRVKELVIPSVRANCVIKGRKDPRQMHRTGYSYRKRIIEECQDPAADLSPSNVIFINREDAPTRRVLNRDEVLDELTEYDVNSITMSNHPFQEQVSLMQDADVIVAPHGAGLLNMLWANDAAVVEIFGSHVTAGNMSLANNIGHEYFCVNATPKGRDISVNPEAVRNTVDQAISVL